MMFLHDWVDLGNLFGKRLVWYEFSGLLVCFVVS